MAKKTTQTAPATTAPAVNAETSANVEETTVATVDAQETVLTIEEAMAKIETLETELVAANEVIASQATLLAENEANASKASVITKEVAGTYKSKEHKVEIRFKPGYLKTRIGHEIIPSEDLILNKGGKYTEELDRLIEIGYGGIEEVK